MYTPTRCFWEMCRKKRCMSGNNPAKLRDMSGTVPRTFQEVSGELLYKSFQKGEDDLPPTVFDVKQHVKKHTFETCLAWQEIAYVT